MTVSPQVAGLDSQQLGDLNQHIATLPIDAKRVKGIPTFVTGQVASDSSITAGSGFTVADAGVGLFDVTFSSPFAAAPTVVACIGTGGSSTRTARVVSVSSSVVQIGTGAGDEPFNFIAATTI